MTVRRDTGNSKLRKHLTIFLQKACYAIYCELNGRESEKRLVFSLFCNLQSRNVLLLQNSKDQCKCLIRENVFLKLDTMGILCDSSLWNRFLCSEELNSGCWFVTCGNCKNGKKKKQTIISKGT